MGFQSSMTFCNACMVLFVVSIAWTGTGTLAIRVDWNTNQGPIVPPTSTVAPVPQPPFRAPAPVWEDQSNDIPNPNPYRYVAPPPSRPRYNPDYYQHYRPSIHATVISPSATTFGSSTLLAAAPTSTYAFKSNAPSAPSSSASSSIASSTTTTTTTSTPPTVASTASTQRPPALGPTYGTIISSPQRAPSQAAGQSQSVSSLAVKFVPNVGKQYVAVVPAAGYDAQQQQFQHRPYLAGNEVYDKFSGKYNAKVKKYKAYEQKAKMVPYVMYYMPKQQFIYYNNFATKNTDQLKRQWNPNQI